MLLVLAAALLTQLNLAISSETCYWPNQDIADSGWVPCFPDGGDLGQCCVRGDACLTNGMCFSAGLAGVSFPLEHIYTALTKHGRFIEEPVPIEHGQ